MPNDNLSWQARKIAKTTSMNNHFKYRHPILIPHLGGSLSTIKDDSFQSKPKQNYLQQCLLRKLQCHQRSVCQRSQKKNYENKEVMDVKLLLGNDLRSRFDVDHNKVFTLATLLNSRYKQQLFETNNINNYKCLLNIRRYYVLLFINL